MRFDAGPLEDFPVDQPRLLTVGGRDLAVLCAGGSVYAVRNVCPHMFSPICTGGVVPLLTASGVGEPRSDREHPILVCGWHGWEFDLETGKAVADPAMRLKKYATAIEDGHVWIDLGGD